MEVVFRPIVAWPSKQTQDRRRSQFKAGYNDTLRLLDRELVYLRAVRVVIQVALGERDIRIDGMPRSGARPSHPGVILSFESKFGPLSYPCDRFTDWEDNLRAIALSLEHLRAVDRYGVTKRGEQYQGWKALPAPTNGFAARDEAAQFILKSGGFSASGDQMNAILANSEVLAKYYREAALRLHPDRGGDAEEFKKLQSAKAIMEKPHVG